MTSAVIAVSGVLGGVANATSRASNSDEVIYAPNGQVDNPDRRSTGSSGEVLGSNPYGCRGQTDYPHKSGIDASTHSRTSCTTRVVRVSTTNSMYRQRWYGAEFLDDGASFRNFAVTSRDAVARWTCGNTGIYTYETRGYHEAFDGGQTFRAETIRSNRFGC